MCGYDPFKYADNYESEEEYLKELEEENMGNKIEIDLDAITKRRDELLDLQARYKFELKQVEKEAEQIDLQLIALLNQTGTDSMDYGTYHFGWVTKQRTAFDQRLFSEQQPDLFNQYKITKENKTFEFKLAK